MDKVQLFKLAESIGY